MYKMFYQVFLEILVTARKRSFYTCLSVILFTGGQYLGRYIPLGRYNPPPGRYTPWQVQTPGRYTPLAGNPLDRYTPRPGTPPRQVHPPRQCMLGDMGNKRMVRILLECILVKNPSSFTNVNEQNVVQEDVFDLIYFML